MLFFYLSLFHSFFFFSFTDPSTTEIYTLSLHDALPILYLSHASQEHDADLGNRCVSSYRNRSKFGHFQRSRRTRSEEHTSELQSRFDLVCRLLLEKKKKKINKTSLVSSIKNEYTLKVYR